jgi:hypothetical protein
LDRRQIDWLDAYQGDSSELIRQLLDAYIEANVSVTPGNAEILKLAYKRRMLAQRIKSMEELHGEIDRADHDLRFAKIDYENFLKKVTGEHEPIKPMEPAKYQQNLEYLKREYDIAKIEFDAVIRKHEDLKKLLAETDDQLLTR